MTGSEDWLLARGEWTSLRPRDPARAELLNAILLVAQGRDEQALAQARGARDQARMGGDRLAGAVAARVAGLLAIRTGREVAGTHEVERADQELDALGVPANPRAALP